MLLKAEQNVGLRRREEHSLLGGSRLQSSSLVPNLLSEMNEDDHNVQDIFILNRIMQDI